MLLRLAFLSVLLVAVGCTSGSDNTEFVLDSAPLLVAAGAEGIAPAPVDTVSGQIDLARLGFDGVAAVYELTTPANEPFAFDVVTRGEDNTGAVRVSVGHAADGGDVPIGSLADAGIKVSAAGMSQRGLWLDANGDGFARFTVRGEIVEDQVIAVEAATGEGKSNALICVRVGPVSEINIVPDFTGDYPGVIDETTLYTSESFLFGLPTVAVSGDRCSIVVYEGDRANRIAPIHQRYELRLQYDHTTKLVTGGGSEEKSSDWGNWRDHEIAALFNVLALVHSGTERVTLQISFDRGASFAQTETIGTALGRGAARLAQIAIAADYTIAVIFWQANAAGTALHLVEGRPSAFDAGGSPTAFAFDAPRILHTHLGDAMPILMGATYSEGGDLAVGYGYSTTERTPEGWTRMTTTFRSAVRLFGRNDFFDVLIDEDELVAKDPSVAVLGSGETMQVFYAYEGRQGLRLRTSNDAGRTWSAPIEVGDRNAHMPTVIARELDGKTAVDLMYIAFGGQGRELHLTQWEDFGATPSQRFRLTEASIGDLPQIQLFAPGPGSKLTELGWFGYDAVLDGDDIVIAYHEVTYDGFIVALELGAPGVALPPGADAQAGAVFQPVEPPPLAPGMTEVLPPPDPDHANKLKIKRYR